jgi:hypothetical protein
MNRLPNIGSDHFPVYVVLQTGRIFEQIQEELPETQDDHEAAQTRFRKGLVKQRKRKNRDG